MSLKELEEGSVIERFTKFYDEVDGFRTHKYTQFEEFKVNLETPKTDEEQNVEGSSITVMYPVAALLKLNDPKGTEIDLMKVRYITGIFHSFYLTSDAQTTPLHLLIGKGALSPEVSSGLYISEPIEGNTTTGWTDVGTFKTMQYRQQRILFKNLDPTHNMNVKIWGYLHDVSWTVLTATEILPSENAGYLVTKTYEKLVIKVKNGSDGVSVPYLVKFIGSDVIDTSVLVNILYDTDAIETATEAIQAQTATGTLIAERINCVGTQIWHFLPQVVTRHITIIVEDMGSNSEIYIGTENVGVLCTEKGQGLQQLPVSNAKQVFVRGNSPQKNGKVSYIGV